MMEQMTMKPSSSARLPSLAALAVAIGLTTLATTGVSAAQHETKQAQGQSQQMPAGPSFARMQEIMQKARQAKAPVERRQLMGQHMQMMGEKMEAMRGMMGDMPMQGQTGGQMSDGQSMGMSSDKSEQMQQMMGEGVPQMMTRMRDHQAMMQQMMEQMLDQQRMMMEMNEQE